jgi:cation:H+ antiporter
MIQDFIHNYQFLFHALVVIISLYLMAKASDLSVYSVSRYARKLGLSDYLIGLLVVAVAASMPELVSSITGATIGAPGIVLGTLFGSNLAGLALVLGVTAIMRKKISTKSKVLQGTGIMIWILVMMPFIFLIDGVLSRIDGILLVISFVIYITFLWKRESGFGGIKTNVKLKNIWKDGLIFSGSLVVLLLSARYLVFSSIVLANSVGISPYLVALTLIAIGATMPDLMVAIKSIKKHHEGVGYGNVIGSMVVKALLFLGIIAIIKPITFEIMRLSNIVIFRTLMITFVLWWGKDKELDWKNGVTLLAMYVLFVAIEIFLR